jgi:hypothetical protein
MMVNGSVGRLLVPWLPCRFTVTTDDCLESEQVGVDFKRDANHIGTLYTDVKGLTLQ